MRGEKISLLKPTYSFETIRVLIISLNPYLQLWMSVYAAYDIREHQPLREAFLKLKRSIIKAGKKSNTQKRADYLVKMLKNAVVTTSFTSGYKGKLVGMLKILAKDQVFVATKIAPPHNVENIFPDGKPLVNTFGVLKYKSRRLLNFDFSGVSFIYNYFYSVIPRDSLTPSLDYNY